MRQTAPFAQNAGISYNAQHIWTYKGGLSDINKHIRNGMALSHPICLWNKVRNKCVRPIV